MQGFGRFVAAQGDMRSELWVCGLAHTDHRCGCWRVHRDTDCQQLRLLVRGRRLHHARGHEALVGLQVSLKFKCRSNCSAVEKSGQAGRGIANGRRGRDTSARQQMLRCRIAGPGSTVIQ